MSKVTPVKRTRSADKTRVYKSQINKLEKENLKLREANAQLANDLETLEKLAPTSPRPFDDLSEEERTEIAEGMEYAEMMISAAEDIAEVASDPQFSAEYVGNYVRSLMADDCECLDDVCIECREKEALARGQKPCKA